jgi:uncharacterized protein
MMLLDANAWLGHYPFRHVEHTTPDGLLGLMDKHQIETAVVSSLHPVFYRDPQPGNEELARWLATHRDRLLPCATLNPAYPGWERDLTQCCEEWDFRGVRLFPTYHNYRLAGPECRELVQAATVRGLHVAIPLRLEDRRGRHWLDTTSEVSLSDIAGLARACPEAEILVLEALGVENSPFVRDPSLTGARVSFEFSRMAKVLQQSIPRLLEALGPDRLVFGTGMPLKYGKAALLKLELLEAPPATRERLAHENMEQLLRRQ